MKVAVREDSASQLTVSSESCESGTPREQASDGSTNGMVFVAV